MLPVSYPLFGAVTMRVSNLAVIVTTKKGCKKRPQLSSMMRLCTYTAEVMLVYYYLNAHKLNVKVLLIFPIDLSYKRSINPLQQRISKAKLIDRPHPSLSLPWKYRGYSTQLCFVKADLQFTTQKSLLCTNDPRKMESQHDRLDLARFSLRVAPIGVGMAEWKLHAT